MELKRCWMYEKGRAIEVPYHSSRIMFCEISPKKCPYKCATEMRGKEKTIGTVCTAKALVNKIEISLEFDLTDSIPLPTKSI